MTKSALLFEMICLLRRRPGMTISELARALNRTERTIYRWFNELAVDFQTPVFCSGGEYYIQASPEESGEGLTPEELLALKFSLRSSPLAEMPPVRQFVKSAWSKIKNTTSSDMLAKAMELSHSHSIDIAAPDALVLPEIIHTLEDAINSHLQLQVIYTSEKSNTDKHYIIDPYSIAFRRHSWYLVGHLHEQGKNAQFKLTRFKKAKKTGKTFELPADFSIDEYFKYSWEAWAEDDPIKVRVKFSPVVTEMIAEVKRHPTQIVYPQPDGGVIFEVTVSGTAEIERWILGYGKEAEVLAPAELRYSIQEQAHGIIALYNHSQTTSAPQM